MVEKIKEMIASTMLGLEGIFGKILININTSLAVFLGLLFIITGWIGSIGLINFSLIYFTGYGIKDYIGDLK